jgi:hypothetical protein
MEPLPSTSKIKLDRAIVIDEVMVMTGLPVVGIINLSPDVGPVAGLVLVPVITQFAALDQETAVVDVGQFWLPAFQVKLRVVIIWEYEIEGIKHVPKRTHKKR